MDYYIKKEDVLKLISEEYYDKFKYESDADEILTYLDHMRGIELTRCEECPNYGLCNFICDVDFVGC